MLTFAQFVHGDPIMVDHTPGAAVTGGDVVVTNDTPRIAHLDIAANALGALAIQGGVYLLPKSNAGGSAIADNKKVFWDNTAKQITVNAAAGANKQIGFTVGASADADTTQRVFHFPG